ncbi:MAG: type II toxin-antitoxin system RelE/ParE family toxin [Candidatus Avelusimicrobium sp.]|uniref:type II toxin-antitoxin system RelE/ParE family toxin n=1 Tax=Candidatus Avelusimicrobium sp. TaxID=3048833 RepID=UPI003F0A3A4B
MKREQTVLFSKWFDKLCATVQDKIADYIDRVLCGNTSNCKSVGKGVYEIKINYQKGYRVYYTMFQGKAVLLLLCGGHKGTQKDDIKQAHAIKEYLEGKYGKQ